VSNEHAPEAPPTDVGVRNTTRSSLSFRVPGRSIRLAPGAVVGLPSAYLDTDEVKTLLGQRALAQVAAPAAATSHASHPDGGPHGSTGAGGAERKTARRSTNR
jgi:hypothetical protein